MIGSLPIVGGLVGLVLAKEELETRSGTEFIAEIDDLPPLNQIWMSHENYVNWHFVMVNSEGKIKPIRIFLNGNEIKNNGSPDRS